LDDDAPAAAARRHRARAFRCARRAPRARFPTGVTGPTGGAGAGRFNTVPPGPPTNPPSGTHPRVGWLGGGRGGSLTILRRGREMGARAARRGGMWKREGGTPREGGKKGTYGKERGRGRERTQPSPALLRPPQVGLNLPLFQTVGLTPTESVTDSPSPPHTFPRGPWSTSGPPPAAGRGSAAALLPAVPGDIAATKKHMSMTSL
jgi:hypothetical protein